MPATGPVAAGGDDGRDGESYWSIVASELPGTSLFTALATDENVVLAVTTQRTEIPSKIRKDLAKICADSAPVDRVIYFTVAPVATSKRHKIQKHARETYAVALDIWDAQAIADELATNDLFYLAIAYLHVPSALAPERPETEAALPDWYAEDRANWRAEGDLTGTVGELVDLREGLRFSALNIEARADLPEWLAAGHRLRASASGNPALLNRIEYELIIATAFGMNTLLPVDSILRDLFGRQQIEEPDPGVVVDSITLLRLVEAMQPRRLTQITLEESRTWLDNLEQTIDRMLANAGGPNVRAHLLCAAAILAHGPASLTAKEMCDLDPETAPDVAEIHLSLRQKKRNGLPMPSAPADGEVRNLDKGMNFLVALADLLPSTPLVPIEEVTTMFDMAAPLLVHHRDYSRVRQALDNATLERAGLAAAGHRAQSRALALLQAKQPVHALREVHGAKMDWLHGESAEGAALMMLLAARIYYELRLPLAAKQYALSAASVAQTNGDPELAVLVARSFMVAATCEHLAGQWLTATQTFRIGVWAQGALAGDPWSFERYPYFHDMLIDQCFILRAARALRPAFLYLIEPVLESTDLNRITDTIVESVDSTEHADEVESATMADKGGLGRPFSDAGPTRRYTWSTLGNVWTVETQNDRRHVLAAERFVAATQIALGDLASEDLLLVPGSITIQVDVSSDPVPRDELFVEQAEHGGKAHLVTLTRGGLLDLDAGQLEVTTAAMQVIATQSLLSQAAFVESMERTFERGLPHMLNCVLPYDELADVHKEGFFDDLRRLDDTYLAPELPCLPDPAPDLAEQEFEQPAPGYDRAEALQAITSRYETLHAPVRLTLRRLASSEAFKRVVEDLRKEGWQDWHLLTAVANIVVNKRAVESGINMTTSISAADVERFRALMYAEEQSSDSVTPDEAFTIDQMWFHLANAAVATARGWGLEVRFRRLEPKAFTRVLGKRFNYWSDDVPHAPLFPESS
ncbi:hypothetical protein [Arthrobacter sp. NPDC089319]|uniref:hypothetical protein n=1 Tax=Arthrobacter sp. NPDC089319 TaxID=3155915 RepID=UPI00342B2C0F